MTIRPLIIESLYFSYPTTTVFSDFTFTTNAKIVIFSGPSGCGKTTLLKLISSFYQPDSAVKFEVEQDSCLIVQEDSLLPWLSGIDNISSILKIPSSQIISHPMYELVGDFIDQKAYTMSYGQRRLVEVFRSVLHRPSLLCFDEPLNFLDISNRKAVVEFLRAKELESTRIVLSTHHDSELEGLEGERYSFEGKLPLQQLTRQT